MIVESIAYGFGIVSCVVLCSVAVTAVFRALRVASGASREMLGD